MIRRAPSIANPLDGARMQKPACGQAERRKPMRATTLCYLEKDNQYLMLHRIRKKNDPNQDKWIGVGGGIEAGETPEDCLLREVREETGLSLTRYQKRGVIDFISDKWEDEVMHLYTADQWEGEIIDCNEGVLEWVDRSKVPFLPLWEGDRVFLKLLAQDAPFFRLRLEYRGEALVRAVLDGKEIEP